MRGGTAYKPSVDRERCDSGGPTVFHNIQCGGGRSGPPLGVLDSVMNGGSRRDDDDAAHPAVRTIRARDNGRGRKEEGCEWLKVK